MKKAVGLYTEIVVTITLLTTAALFFSGFLLVNLTQRELIEQRIQSVVAALEVFSRATSDNAKGGALLIDSLPFRADYLSGLLSSASSLDGWGLVDRDLIPQALPSLGGSYQLEMSDLSQIRETGETLIKVRFPSVWIPFGAPEEAFVKVTVDISGFISSR